MTAPFFEVIGVVKDDCIVKTVCDNFAPPEPAVYVPVAQAARFSAADARVDHGLKAGEEKMSKHMAAELRSEASAMDAQLRIVVRPLSEIAERVLGPLRVIVILASTLGSLAMILAAIGIYGVMAYSGTADA